MVNNLFFKFNLSNPKPGQELEVKDYILECYMIVLVEINFIRII